MEKPSYRILLVDDEKDILEFLGYNLQKAGYEIFKSQNGKEAIELAIKIRPSLILLDVMMPEMDGIETCEEMRKNRSLDDSLIVFLTARGEDYSQIAGFEAGADDYLTKPVKPKVLISRIKAILKRTGKTDHTPEVEELPLITLPNLIIDQERYLIIKDGVEIILPKKEFELLKLLISKPEKVFTREEIFSRIWGQDVIVGERTIDVHIRKLREKIDDDRIITVKGVGYKYVMD